MRIYYGTSDGGQNAAAWDEVYLLGQRGAGTFTATLGALAADTTYFYRITAQNSAGTVWTGMMSFRTGVLPGTTAVRHWSLY